MADKSHKAQEADSLERIDQIEDQILSLRGGSHTQRNERCKQPDLNIFHFISKG